MCRSDEQPPLGAPLDVVHAVRDPFEERTRREHPGQRLHSRERGGRRGRLRRRAGRSEEHTSELQSRSDLVCRLLLEKKKKKKVTNKLGRNVKKKIIQYNEILKQAAVSNDSEHISKKSC